jgi:hypothetical protein
VVLLSSLAGQEPEILDPDGGDLQTFRTTYAAIDCAVRALARRIDLLAREEREGGRSG